MGPESGLGLKDPFKGSKELSVIRLLRDAKDAVPPLDTVDISSESLGVL